MKISEYKNFGRCAWFEKGSVRMAVTLDIGPRIIYYGTAERNFMNEDIERNVSKDGEWFDTNYKPGERWYLYGGHRVWKSPEDLDSYTPDNYPVEADIDGDGGTFVCRAGRNYDYSLTVRMAKDGSADIVNRITNKSREERRISVWALTVSAKGGTLILPLNDPVDELNPVQNIVHWPYNDLADERLTMGRHHMVLRQTDKEEAFKAGLFLKKGRAYYVIGDKALAFEFSAKEGFYGDLWCNFETYTNRHILEVETLSPLYTLAPGESAQSEERWSIIDAADVAVK